MKQLATPTMDSIGALMERAERCDEKAFKLEGHARRLREQAVRLRSIAYEDVGRVAKDRAARR